MLVRFCFMAIISENHKAYNNIEKESETFQLWIRRGFALTKFLQIALLVAICVIALIGMNQNFILFIMLIPSICCILANVFLFSFRIEETIPKEEMNKFAFLFVLYTIAIGVIILFDQKTFTKYSGSPLQNSSEQNQELDTIQIDDNGTFSYSVRKKSNKTEKIDPWEAAKRLRDNVIKYGDDDSPNSYLKEKNSNLIPIYNSIFILVFLTVLSQGFCWVLTRNINPNVQELNEANPQNEEIPMEPLEPVSENSVYVPSPSGGSSQQPLLLQTLSTHRTHSASEVNVSKQREVLDEINYDSVSEAGPTMDEAGLRSFLLEKEKFHPRNNLSSSTETLVIGESLQRRSVGTSSEMGSRGIIPE